MIATRIDKSNDVIQGMWIGDKLSVMERLSINSFLVNGHPFHLYVYSDVKQVPSGTVVLDGRDILPESSIFQYRDHGSYAGFANFFRYELLLRRGGWWVDLDTVCLQTFCFENDYVIGTEPIADGSEHPTSGVLKAPADSEFTRFLSRGCQSRDRNTLRWGETGPKLVAEAVERFSLHRFLQPQNVFCPLGYYHWDKILDADYSFSFDNRPSIHLWNEMWRRNGQDKNATYHPACIYERLKNKYL